MCFEVVPGPCGGGTCIPDFAVLEVKASFKYQCVGDVEELFGSVWLAAIVSVVLAVFYLFDEAIERTVGVPSSAHFGIVVFKLEGGYVAVVIEQVSEWCGWIGSCIRRDGLSRLEHICRQGWKQAGF